MGRPLGSKNGSRIEHDCVMCGVNFRNHNRKTKYCSHRCFTNKRRKETFSNCLKCNIEILHRRSNGNRRVRIFCSKNCSMSFRMKVTPTRYWLGKKRLDMRGEQNPMWTPNPKSDPRKLERHQIHYKEWRRLVFIRDDYTCQKCAVRGVALQADHELSYRLFPELRYEILNGRTLCISCHVKTSNYGRRRDPFDVAVDNSIE